MARDLDAQLLESVTVRRARLRDALLWGRLRSRRAISDNLARVLIGAVVAAVLSAGCVGWSFLQDALAKQAAQQRRSSTPVTPAATRPSRPAGQQGPQQRASRTVPPRPAPVTTVPSSIVPRS